MDVVGVAFEVLPKLGYEVDVNSFEEKNLKGLSTQITYAPMVRVKGRIRREIKVRGTTLSYLSVSFDAIDEMGSAGYSGKRMPEFRHPFRVSKLPIRQ